jgi:hypothetical protein
MHRGNRDKVIAHVTAIGDLALALGDVIDTCRRIRQIGRAMAPPHAPDELVQYL